MMTKDTPNFTAAPTPQTDSVGTEVFTYNTTTPPPLVKKHYELLPLYNEHNPMLKLRQPELDFSSFPANIVEFARQLDYTMNHYGGMGLAAPQCGFPYRMFVMSGGVVCINPKILRSADETIREKEGCLSYPGLFLPITRPRSVHVEYYTVSGQRVEETFTGATARVFQHECDHLDGKVFTRYVGTLTLQMAKKKKEKMFKKIKRIVEHKEAQIRYTGSERRKINPVTGPEVSKSIISHRES
jgi:peptide deformylase